MDYSGLPLFAHLTPPAAKGMPPDPVALERPEPMADEFGHHAGRDRRPRASRASDRYARDHSGRAPEQRRLPMQAARSADERVGRHPGGRHRFRKARSCRDEHAAGRSVVRDAAVGAHSGQGLPPDPGSAGRLATRVRVGRAGRAQRHNSALVKYSQPHDGGSGSGRHSCHGRTLPYQAAIRVAPTRTGAADPACQARAEPLHALLCRPRDHAERRQRRRVRSLPLGAAEREPGRVATPGAPHRLRPVEQGGAERIRLAGGSGQAAAERAALLIRLLGLPGELCCRSSSSSVAPAAVVRSPTITCAHNGRARSSCSGGRSSRWQAIWCSRGCP